MWVVALVVSLGLLVFSIAGSRSRGLWWLLGLGQLLALASPMFLCMALPPVAMQAVGGLIALPLLAVTAGGTKYYRVAAVGAFFAGWVVVGGQAVVNEREYARLRTVYPFEMMNDRLTPQPHGNPVAFDSNELAVAEEQYERRDQPTVPRWDGGRNILLRRLHEEQLELFTETAGFGVGRMGILNEKPTTARLAEDAPPNPTSEPSLHQMVRDDTLDFADPRRWGYRRDDRVAGFLPHALRRQPGPAMGWAVERVELVGLLLAPDPRVYVSETLPRMDELKAAPTRHPDGFESPALAKLRAGEELVHDAPLGRLLGAVRAAKQCLQCHGGDRGQLLGAFSYRLKAR